MTMYELARPTPDATPEAAVEVIVRDGGLIIEGLFDEARIEGVEKDLGPALDGRNTTADEYRFGLSTGYDLALHHGGRAEVGGQMSGPEDLLSRDDYTAIGAGLPGLV